MEEIAYKQKESIWMEIGGVKADVTYNAMKARVTLQTSYSIATGLFL